MGDVWVGNVWACVLISVGCEVQHVARCDFLLPRNLIKTVCVSVCLYMLVKLLLCVCLCMCVCVSVCVSLSQAGKRCKHVLIPASDRVRIESESNFISSIQTSRHVPWTHITSLTQLFSCVDQVDVSSTLTLSSKVK